MGQNGCKTGHPVKNGAGDNPTEWPSALGHNMANNSSENEPIRKLT